MDNVVSPRCPCGSGIQPSCGMPGGKATNCGECALKGMKCLKGPKCTFVIVETGKVCGASASHGIRGGKAILCAKHTTGDHANVTNKRCEGKDGKPCPHGKNGSGAMPRYGIERGKATHCKKCASKDVMFNLARFLAEFSDFHVMNVEAFVDAAPHHLQDMHEGHDLLEAMDRARRQPGTKARDARLARTRRLLAARMRR